MPLFTKVLFMKPQNKKILRYWQLYFFLLIPLAYLIIFCYVPMLGIQIAFRSYSASRGIFGSSWVGLKFFDNFIHSFEFRRIIVNTLRISIYSIIVGFPIPLFLALMLNCVRYERLKKTMQNILYMPHFISTVVIVGMIMQVINPVSGLYGRVYFNIMHTRPSDIMANPSVFPHMYVWSGIWQNMGWDSVIYLAALSGVDPALHEAACIDGAGRLRRVIHVDIPCILPTFVIILFLRCGSIMSVGFEKAYLLQNDLNLRTSELISTYVYKVGLTSTGTGSQFSFATAIGLFNSVINLLILSFVNAISKRLTERSLW